MKNRNSLFGKHAKSFARVLAFAVMLMMVFLLQGCMGSTGGSTISIATIEAANAPIAQDSTEAPHPTQVPVTTEAPAATVEPTPEPTVKPTLMPTEAPASTATPFTTTVSAPAYAAPYPSTVTTVTDSTVAAEDVYSGASSVSAEDNSNSSDYNCTVQVIGAEPDCSTTVDTYSEGNTTYITIRSGK
jgi:hypothetical protein